MKSAGPWASVRNITAQNFQEELLVAISLDIRFHVSLLFSFNFIWQGSNRKTYILFNIFVCKNTEDHPYIQFLIFRKFLGVFQIYSIEVSILSFQPMKKTQTTFFHYSNCAVLPKAALDIDITRTCNSCFSVTRVLTSAVKI